MSAVARRLARLLWTRHWRRMLFFSSCIAAGVAVLVGVGNLMAAVEASVAGRARELLGADVALSSQRPFDSKVDAALERLRAEGHRWDETVSFASMLDPVSAAPFLVSVKAVGPSYPLYGRLETAPPGVRLEGRQCLLDEQAAVQRGLKPGDAVELGGVRLRVAALLVKEPDRTMSGFNLSPRLIVPRGLVKETGLAQFGSRIAHARQVALKPGPDAPGAARRLKDRLERELSDPYVSVTSYTEADGAVRDTLERTGVFFVFLSLVALLLGAIGMSASVTMFLNEQLETAAILRCLGMAGREVGQVYALICAALGLCGGALGCLAGWVMSAAGVELAARLLRLTVPVVPTFDPLLLAEGLMLACAASVGLNFAKVRALARVPPMDVLRERAGRLRPARRSWAAMIAAGGGALFLYAFAKSNSWASARLFAGALAGSTLAVVALIGLALAALAASTRFWTSFPLRHAALRLTRQKSRTLTLLFTLSMGLTLLGALGIVHRSLRSEILLGRSDSVPDLFLVDVQKTQLAGVLDLVARYARAPASAAPLIRARLTHVNGAPVARRDMSRMTVEQRARQRFLTREYNLTYKDALQDSEKLVAGAFWAPGETRPQVSLEERFCERVGVGLGDTLAFDVQGRPVEAVVTSIRRIDWMSMRPNFFVVFPTRVLEPAPQTFIAALQVRDLVKSGAFQRELVDAFPNVSVIDLTKVLDNVQSVLGATIAALNALAWFCVGVGTLVLAGTLGLGRRERAEQAALYRALGCSRRRLVAVDAAEFAAIGLIAFAIAAATSHLLGWAIARQMDIGFAADPAALAAMFAAAILLPVGVGLAIQRSSYASGVLDALRREA